MEYTPVGSTILKRQRELGRSLAALCTRTLLGMKKTRKTLDSTSLIHRLQQLFRSRVTSKQRI